MDLIERYLQAIGRHLPRSRRKDILPQLRASLMSALEVRSGGNVTAAAAEQVIKEMGPPHKVAAAYHPEGQYLIGPTLYPTFRLVLGIVLAAVVGGQFIALLVAVGMGQKTVSVLAELAAIANSLPAAIGMVVIVFALLQYYGVRPDLREGEFDPRKLPPLEGEEPVKRAEQIISIVMGTVVLALLTQYVWRGELAGIDLFANPVIGQYFVWIGLSMVIGILLDIWLLWQGRWTTALRLAKIGSGVFSLVMLALLIQGHTAWLAERGLAGLFDGLTQLAPLTEQKEQILGMAAFRMAFTVAFVVTAIDTVLQLYRLARGALAGGGAHVVAVK